VSYEADSATAQEAENAALGAPRALPGSGRV